MLILPFILNRSIPFYNNKNVKKTTVNFEYAVYKKEKFMLSEHFLVSKNINIYK